MGPRSGGQGSERQRRHHGPADRADLRRFGSQSGGRRAKGGKAVRGQQCRFPHRHRQFGRHARGRPGCRARQEAADHHGVVRRQHHRRQVLGQRVPRQRQGRPAVHGTGGVAGENTPEGESVLSRPRLSDGPLHRRRVQGGGRACRRHQPRRGVRAARLQGLFAVFRPDSRRPAAGALYFRCRQRHRASVHADAGIRPAQGRDRARRLRHRHLAEHRRHRQGRGRLHHRRRLFGGDRHSGQQSLRRRVQGREQGRAGPLRRRFLRADLCLQGGGGEGEVDRHRQGARRAQRPHLVDAAGR